MPGFDPRARIPAAIRDRCASFLGTSYGLRHLREEFLTRSREKNQTCLGFSSRSSRLRVSTFFGSGLSGLG